MVITGQGQQKELGLLSLGSDMILHPENNTRKGKTTKTTHKTKNNVLW